jgi:Flp pilus assembly protein TadD
LTSRFVKPGKPAVEMGPEAGSGWTLDTYLAKVRHLSATAKPVRKQTLLPTIEQRDPALSMALLQLAVYQTAAANRRVAERYRQLGVLDAAHRHYQQAIVLDGEDAAAWDGMARIWRDWGFPHLGVPDAHRAAYFAPDSPGPQNTLGTLFQAMGRTSEAREAYRRAVALDPAAAYALSNLCYLSFLESRMAQAAEECAAALAIDPQHAAARNNLALVHAASGRLDLAQAEFLKVDPAAGQYNLGIVHMSAGRYESAVEAFTEAHRLRPSARALERARQALRLAQATP